MVALDRLPDLRVGDGRQFYLGNVTDMFSPRAVTHDLMTAVVEISESTKEERDCPHVSSNLDSSQHPHPSVDGAPFEDIFSDEHLRDSYFSMLRMGFPHTAAAIQNIRRLTHVDVSAAKSTQVECLRRSGWADTPD